MEGGEEGEREREGKSQREEGGREGRREGGEEEERKGEREGGREGRGADVPQWWSSPVYSSSVSHEF